MPGIIGSTGWDRSNAWTWDFSSTHSTRACSGGSRYSPTTSRTLSMNCGSELSLKVSARCGLSRNAFQIRPTVDFDSPERFGHRRPRPVRGILGRLLQGGHHYGLDLLVGDRAGCARPRLVDQPGQPARDEPGPPLGDRLGPNPQLGGDRLVRRALGAGQHDPTPQRQRLRRFRPPRPAHQRLALLIGQHQWHLGTTSLSHSRTIPDYSSNFRRRTLDDLFQGVLVIVGDEGPGGWLPGVVVVPDRSGQGEDALQHPHDDACRGVPAVAFQVELALEG